jgi:Ca-activated chloride channel family protein
MKRSQLIVVLAAVAAIAAIVVAGRGGGGDKPQGAAARASSSGPAGAVRVTMASSPEKLALVQALAKDFNASGAKVGGRPVFVSAYTANSGDEEAAIARAARGPGGDRPVVWSPASTLWARLLDNETDRGLVATKNPSIVRSPLVLAMWEPLARALGYPRKPIGWADVLRLAQDPRGWAAYGHPEYGQFKLVHTNPSVSTSGLEAVTAAYFAATGKKEGLTAADIRRPAVQREIGAIEQSIVHYGNATPYIEGQLRLHGTSYASAVAMEETTLVDFNRHRGDQPKLVGIYPAEGTFYSDSPYVILQAPWVDKSERAGAQAFQRYIGAHVTRTLAARYNLRPPNPDSAPMPPIDATNGADPHQPTRVLEMPEASVVAQIQQAWFANRKAANIELVVDTSGSMGDESKLSHAQRGLEQFLGRLSPRDRVGLIAFSSGVRELMPVQPFSAASDQLRERVRGLVADGDTALYDATDEAVSRIAALHDPERINAVVVLSDGQDNSGQTLDDLLPHLTAHTGPEANPIRVFTIAYGKGATVSILGKIASASDGQLYVGDTGDIETVYKGISSFF